MWFMVFVSCEGFTPQNTTKTTDWALRVFQEWQKQRDGDQCPSDLLESPSAEKLNYWLSCFVIECRRVDGQPYPSSTLYQLLAGLFRFSRSKSEDFPNFLDKKDPRFWCIILTITIFSFLLIITVIINTI